VPAHLQNPVRVSTCCEPVREAGFCGSFGYGYRWLDEDRHQRLRPLVEEQDLRDSLDTHALLAVFVAIVSAIWASLLLRHLWSKNKSLMVLANAVALANVGFAVSQFLARKLIDLSPLGWMRINNVLSVTFLTSLVVHLEFEDEQVPVRELIKYGMFAITATAQEKFLWKPEVCNVLPLAAMAATWQLKRHLGGFFAAMSVFSASIILICNVPVFSKAQVSQDPSNGAMRLFAATVWPLLVLPLASFYFRARKRQSIWFPLLLSVLMASSLIQISGNLDQFYLRSYGVGGLGRWCCLDPRETKDCKNGHRSVSWFHHTERDPSTPWPWEVHAMMIITVLTNMSGVPATIHSWLSGSAFAAVIGAGTIATSTLYHLGDTTDDYVLGMTEGNWHRLDNVFSILSFISLQIYVIAATWSHEDVEFTRTLFIVLVMFLQELGPWRLECTLIPIFCAFFLFVHYCRSNPKVWEELREDRSGSFLRASQLLAIGVCGFYFGLDEDNDYLRIAHGAWHLFTGLSFYFFSKGLRVAVSGRFLKEKKAE